MPLQNALAKLFRSSSCYPFARGVNTEIRWQATPPDYCAGYLRDQPRQDETPVIATYESLHPWFIGNVRENASQVCDPDCSGMKLKYIAEGPTPPAIHIAVEFGAMGSSCFPTRKRPGSIVPISDVVRNHSAWASQGGGAQLAPGPAPGARSLPGPLRLFRSSRTLGNEMAAKEGIWRSYIQVYCW
jgi:hypothetical protein